jgi:NADH-quinone oxidoreductase subunit J
MNEATIDVIVLALLLVATLWTVLTPRLLRAVLGLAVASIMVTVLLFRLDSPLAGVFELSVCAGLISAIFLGAITLTQPETDPEIAAGAKERIRRYWYLPVLLLFLGVIVAQKALPSVPSVPANTEDVREVLWSSRHLDLLGQVVILVAGAFGVVVLFKEAKKNER